MKELQRENMNRRINCGQINPEAGPKKRTPCCTLSPVTPTPLVKTNVCERQRLPSRNFCTTVQNECDRPELTAYGREFMANNGKLVSKKILRFFKHEVDHIDHDIEIIDIY